MHFKVILLNALICMVINICYLFLEESLAFNSLLHPQSVLVDRGCPNGKYNFAPKYGIYTSVEISSKR